MTSPTDLSPTLVFLLAGKLHDRKLVKELVWYHDHLKQHGLPRGFALGTWVGILRREAPFEIAVLEAECRKGAPLDQAEIAAIRTETDRKALKDFSEHLAWKQRKKEEGQRLLERLQSAFTS